MKLNQFKLDNKLTCLLIPRNNIELFTLQVFVRVGARDENDKTRGSSHLLEHMLFKGTKNRKTYDDIYRELDLYGGVFNASTSKNMTCYYLTAPVKYIENCLDLISDILFNSTITQYDIEKEKQVVIEELYLMLDNSQRLSIEHLFSLCFKDHPLEHSTIGTEKHILNFKRSQIYNYYKKFYNTNNMFLTICGKYPKNIKQLINKYFTNVNQSSKQEFNPIPKITLPKQIIPRIKVITQKKENCAIAIGYPTYNLYDLKNTIIVQLISNLFGGSVSSRLYSEIREKATLAYSISSGSEFYQDAGIFYITALIDKDSLYKNNNLKNPKGALYILLTEIENIRKKGVLKKELEDSKQSIISKLILNQETTSSINDFYGYQLAFKEKFHSFKEIEKIFNSITLEEINNECKKLFSFNNLNLCVIGDYKEKDVYEYIFKKFL